MLNYTINPRGIACEHFQDETIILNLPKGSYYSLKGTGQLIWSQLEKNTASSEIAALLSVQYHITTDEALAALEPFIKKLAQEELIAETDAVHHTASAVETFTPNREPFTEPVLEVYTDMQELLMLDPIHDADPGKGWPYTNNA